MSEAGGTLPPSPRGSRPASIFAGALMAIFGATYLFHPGQGHDFHAYFCAMKWLGTYGSIPYFDWNGSPIMPADHPWSVYCRTEWGRAGLQFLYPPSSCLQLRLFTWPSSLFFATFLWRVFNLSVLLFLLRFVRSRVAPDRELFPLILLLGAYAPLRETVWVGQVTVWISFLVVVSLFEMERGRGFAAGAALGTAVALKAYPILWAPLILLTPRAVPAFILGAALTGGGMTALSVLEFGPGAWSEYNSRVVGPVFENAPLGTLSLQAWLPMLPGRIAESRLFRRLLFLVPYALTVALILARGARSAHFRSGGGRRRATLALTAVIFAFLPLVWEHYLTLLGILLAAELVSVFGEFRKHARLTTLYGFVYLSTGAATLLSVIPGGTDRRVMIQAGLLAACLAPFVGSAAAGGGTRAISQQAER